MYVCCVTRLLSTSTSTLRGACVLAHVGLWARSGRAGCGRNHPGGGRCGRLLTWRNARGTPWRATCEDKAYEVVHTMQQGARGAAAKDLPPSLSPETSRPQCVHRAGSVCPDTVAAAVTTAGARWVAAAAFAAERAAVSRHASHARSADRCNPMRLIHAGRAALSASTPSHWACVGGFVVGGWSLHLHTATMLPEGDIRSETISCLVYLELP